MAKEHAKRFGNRLTGFSTPLIGASWTPALLDADVARQVLAEMENRRVLYSPYEVEDLDHAARSVIEIRRHLTDQIGRSGVASELRDSLRAMRAASIEFLGVFGNEGNEIVVPPWTNGMHDFQMNQALGKMRGLFGVQLAQMAARFDIEVEPALASIFPPPAD